MSRQTVCIFCASSNRTPESYQQEAIRLGQLCAHKGIRIVNGAGAFGLMGLLTDSCLENGGQVTGVIPLFMVKNGWCHSQLTELIVTDDMAIRKQKMRDLSDGVIVMPGGPGTAEELFETLTQRQLGLFNHPIILLNINGYFDDFIAWWNKATDQHFIRSEHQTLWTVVQNAEEAVKTFLTEPDRQEPEEKRVL